MRDMYMEEKIKRLIELADITKKRLDNQAELINLLNDRVTSLE